MRTKHQLSHPLRSAPVAWAGALVAATALTGCQGAAESRSAPATTYFDALHQAWSTSFDQVAQFMTVEGELDMRGLSGYQGSGRADVAQALRDDWHGAVTTVTSEEPVYVSTDGAVDPSRFTFGTSVIPQALVFEMSEGGFAQMLWAGSVKSAAWYINLDREPVDRLAETYVAAWAGADPTTVDGLYAPSATLTDSLLGVDLTGLEPIAAAIASETAAGGLPGATEHEIPEDGGIARYDSRPSTGNGFGPLLGITMLLDVPGDGGCPGPVAASLTLDEDGLITHEERYHRVDAVDRCFSDLPAVWWDTTAVPDLSALTRTGDISQGPVRIALWNSSPAREQLLRWALTRYADGLLAPPDPESVWFVPSDDPWTRYGFVPGASDVPLPATATGCPAEGCDPWTPAARAQALTALAHRWLAGATRHRSRDEYAETIGQQWFAPGTESDRYRDLGPAARRAADTVAWGLMDAAYPLPDDIADRTCEELGADFLLLTDAPTAGRACAAAPG